MNDNCDTFIFHWSERLIYFVNLILLWAFILYGACVNMHHDHETHQVLLY